MKKFMYLSIAAITIGMAACSSDDEFGETESLGVVKTQFNIAIPGSPQTRMSESVTQAQNPPVFRGMEQIHLIPFAKNGEIVSTDNRFGNELTLSTTGAVPAISSSNTISSLNVDNNSQFYKDVEVPIGTRSFLFYGVAPKSGTDVDPQTDGQINATGLVNTTQTPAGITFDLQNIIADNATTDAKATALVTYLNLIAKNNDWDATTDPLHDMYTEFITLKAGSSADVQALVQDLYTEMLKRSDHETAGTSRYKIIEDITNSTYVSAVNTTGVLTFTSAISGYPANIKLPDGAAIVNWKDATDGFVVATALSYNDNATPTPNVLFNVPTLQDYVYPASLYYRANSLINTASTSKEQYYYGTGRETTWAGVLAQYENRPGTVLNSTKSIALVDEVEYAVGRMDLSVKAAGSTLQDNDDKSFDVSNLQVTGLLIGGQKQVDFEFLPVSTAQEKTIYDNKPENVSLTTSEQLANRTLVLETEDDVQVKFAIEFQNNGDAFQGFDGIVPTNCKFYLIGNINPSSTGGTTISGSRQKDKNGNDIIRVFLQDFVTTVTANINSLKHAYNVIPDLRSPKLELGLSVNLTWNPANTYVVSID